jgi:hypothetical protein
VIPNRRRCRSSIFHGDMSRFSFLGVAHPEFGWTAQAVFLKHVNFLIWWLESTHYKAGLLYENFHTLMYYVNHLMTWLCVSVSNGRRVGGRGKLVPVVHFLVKSFYLFFSCKCKWREMRCKRHWMRLRIAGR